LSVFIIVVDHCFPHFCNSRPM